MNEYFLKSALLAIVVIVLLCCNTHHALAQTRDSLLRVYNTETIHSFGRFYVKGSKQLKFWDLKSEFPSGITRDLYKQSKGKLILTRLFTFTSVAALITGALVKKNNSGASIALNIAGIALNLGSLHFRKQSTEIIDRAIWQRNKEILFGVQ